MRVVLAVVGLLTFDALSARADEVDDLVARGEELAKRAEWSRAIDAFKAADVKRPRARHACLISLAYTRREAWAEAELFLATCMQRASKDDPAPDWAETARQQLLAKLAASNAAPVTIVVRPPQAMAVVSVSSFAPGETFTPRTIHLSPGTHVITVTAPGFKPAKREITIANNLTQDVTVQLESSEARPGWPPITLMVAGAALFAGGVAYDELVFRPAAKGLSNYQTALGYYQRRDAVERERTIAIGLVVTGGAAVVLGAVLRLTVFRQHDRVTVGASAQRGSALLTLDWSR